MKRYNVIMIADPDRTHLLMCRRMRDPFRGKYNMVGGHVEAGESEDDAAYRELYEESGITRDDVSLTRVMDLVYHYEDLEIEVYAGRLRHPVEVRGDENPLTWISIDENFFDKERFAGNGNIGHILIETLLTGVLD